MHWNKNGLYHLAINDLFKYNIIKHIDSKLLYFLVCLISYWMLIFFLLIYNIDWTFSLQICLTLVHHITYNTSWWLVYTSCCMTYILHTYSTVHSKQKLFTFSTLLFTSNWRCNHLVVYWLLNSTNCMVRKWNMTKCPQHATTVSPHKSDGGWDVPYLLRQACQHIHI